MLKNWLKPISGNILSEIDGLQKESFGKNILLYAKDMPVLRGVHLAIVGLGDTDADEIRRHLYKMSFYFSKNRVADLGNVRNNDPSFVITLIQELLASKITPVLIGGKDAASISQFHAYQNAKSLVNLSVVDERLRFSLNSENTAGQVYNSILSPRHPLLFHLGLVGCQSHLMPQQIVGFTDKQHFDVIRLGKSRFSIEETEPLIRDADLLIFHLAALKQSEAPGVPFASPSGYFCEEACQLCRYAGMSDKLTSFGVYGFEKELDVREQTAQVVSQMVWYFIEGFFNRKGDFPVSTDGLVEYIVDLPRLQYQITFWKSVKSGRWWMQVPLNVQQKQERHRMVPCSYQDYQMAVQEELPDRLLQAFKRFG